MRFGLLLLTAVILVGCANSPFKTAVENVKSVFVEEKPEKPNPYIYRNIAYTVGNSPQQSLDIYLPETMEQNRPVLMFVHGGGWVSGDKKEDTFDHVDVFTNKGIIVVSVNYRLGEKGKHPNQVSDLAVASQWVRTFINRYGGDPNNILLVGQGAGAHLVALLGTHPRYLPARGIPQNMFRGIVPIDTASFDMTQPQKGKVAKLVQIERNQVFGLDKDKLKDASPLYQAENTALMSPFLVFVAAASPDAIEQSNKFVNKLLDNGHTADIQILTNNQANSNMAMSLFIEGSFVNKLVMKFFDKKIPANQLP